MMERSQELSSTHMKIWWLLEIMQRFIIILGIRWVRSFTPDYQALEKVSIVDAAVQYTCQYMEKVYVLMFRNALVVPSMENNIIPSFVVI